MDRVFLDKLRRSQVAVSVRVVREQLKAYARWDMVGTTGNNMKEESAIGVLL